MLYAALRAWFCRGQGFMPNPGKIAFYRVTNPEGLVVAMNAALPFMDGEMRDFAARTLAKVEHMTEAEFAGLALYPADEV